MSKKVLTILICSVGGLITIVTGIISFFSEDWYQSFFVALSVNVLTSILAYVFITLAIEQVDKKKEERMRVLDERNAIQRYLPFLKRKINIYLMQFNELTQDKKTTSNNGIPHEFNDIVVSNMVDMFSESLLARNAPMTSIIESYHHQYLSFSSFIERMLFSIDYSKYSNIKTLLEELLLISNASNGIESLISYDKYHNSGDPKESDTIIGMMKIYNGDINSDITTFKYSESTFLNVLLLCLHLKRNKSVIQELMGAIHSFEEDK